MRLFFSSKKKDIIFFTLPLLTQNLVVSLTMEANSMEWFQYFRMLAAKLAGIGSPLLSRKTMVDGFFLPLGKHSMPSKSNVVL